jgi:hypothetical protein
MMMRRTLLGASGAALLGMTCSRAAENISQFGLQSCPDRSFSLPSRRVDGNYSVVRMTGKSYQDPTQPGSEVYRLYRDDEVLSHYRVKIVNAQPCRLAVEYSTLLDKESRSDSAMAQARERAGIVARLILQGTSSTPTFPALWVEHRYPGQPPDTLWSR